MTATIPESVIPETPEQLEEALHDEARMQNIFAQGNFGKFTHAYMKAFVGKSADDIKAFKAQAQADMADFMRVQAEQNGAKAPGDWKPGDKLSLLQGRGPRRERAAARYRGPLAGAQDTGEFFDRQGLFSARAAGAAEGIDNADYADSLGKFIYSAIKAEYVAKQGGDSGELEKLQSFKGSLAKALEIRNASSMAERIPAEGGFLVPENLRSEILALSLEDGVMRPNATIIPMDSLRVPIPTVDDTSHASNVFGGVAAYWTAEGAALKGSAPSFSRVLLEAAKLTAFTLIPNELLQDSSTPMEVWFRTFFPQAVSFFADLAFLVGDGVNQPEGVLNCPGAVTVTRTTSAQVLFADLAAMMARMWPPSLKRAMWVCSPDVLPFLFQLGLTVGGTAIAPPAWLADMQAIGSPGGSDGSGFNFRLFGRPLRVTEKVPTPGAGNTGSIALIDPTYYLIGDRQAMQVASSAEYSFANDEVAYRITERLDGRGWLRSPLTPANGGSTLSPFVLLTT